MLEGTELSKGFGGNLEDLKNTTRALRVFLPGGKTTKVNSDINWLLFIPYSSSHKNK